MTKTQTKNFKSKMDKIQNELTALLLIIDRTEQDWVFTMLHKSRKYLKYAKQMMEDEK